MFLAFILETCSGLFISSDSRYNVCITLHSYNFSKRKETARMIHSTVSVPKEKNKIPSCRIHEGVHENNTR